MRLIIFILLLPLSVYADTSFYDVTPDGDDIMITCDLEQGYNGTCFYVIEPKLQDDIDYGSCATLVGFSVTQQMYTGLVRTYGRPTIGAQFKGGGTTTVFSSPKIWSKTRYKRGLCRKPDTERLIYMVVDKDGTVDQIAESLSSALDAMIESRAYSNVRQVQLLPIPGMADDSLCKSNGPNNVNGYVHASWYHKSVSDAIERVVESKYIHGVDLYAGPHLHVDSCSDYSDGIGHISKPGPQNRLADKFKRSYLK